MEGAVQIQLSQLLVGDHIVVENLVWEVTAIEFLSRSNGSPFGRMVDLQGNGTISSIILDPMSPLDSKEPPLRIRLFKSATEAPTSRDPYED